MPSRASTRSILLVEDNPDDRMRIHRMLRGHRRHYEIVDGATGAEGIALIERSETRFDCVLLDQYLPDMTGDGVLRRLRGANARLPVPVSMLTGHNDDDAAALALEIGAEDYLLKDEITPHALMRSIENVIERFEIRQQLDTQHAAVALRNERLEHMRAEAEAHLEELKTATRTRDGVVAMMSHEMRTPLNAILGYTALLEMEIDGPLSEHQHLNLSRIRVGSRHLLDLVNDVLDLAKADTRRLEMVLHPVDTNATIDEVAAFLENSAAERGLSLIRRLDPLRPLVTADPQRLRQILLNLVGNAIKFTDHGDVIVTSRIVAEGRDVAVTVTDSGIGIEPHAMARVFQEFYQGDNARIRRHGGSGLGLAISLRLARAMGGNIECASTVGEGSAFTLTLPAVQSSPGGGANEAATCGEWLQSGDGLEQDGSVESVAPVIRVAEAESASIGWPGRRGE